MLIDTVFSAAFNTIGSLLKGGNYRSTYPAGQVDSLESQLRNTKDAIKEALKKTNNEDELATLRSQESSLTGQIKEITGNKRYELERQVAMAEANKDILGSQIASGRLYVDDYVQNAKAPFTAIDSELDDVVRHYGDKQKDILKGYNKQLRANHSQIDELQSSLNFRREDLPNIRKQRQAGVESAVSAHDEMLKAAVPLDLKERGLHFKQINKAEKEMIKAQNSFNSIDSEFDNFERATNRQIGQLKTNNRELALKRVRSKGFNTNENINAPLDGIATGIEAGLTSVGTTVGKAVHDTVGAAVNNPVTKAVGLGAAYAVDTVANVGFEVAKTAGKGVYEIGKVAAPIVGGAAKATAGAGYAVGKGAVEQAAAGAKFMWNTRDNRAMQIGLGVAGATVYYPAAIKQANYEMQVSHKTSNLSLSGDNGGLLLHGGQAAPVTAGMKRNQNISDHLEGAPIHNHGATGDLVFALHNLRNGG